MKKLLFTLLFLTFGTAWGGAFEDGFAAAESKDYATAFKLWRPLAEQGDAVAKSNLGVMYRRGEGVTQDDKEALKWYRLAAAQGYASAQFNLGTMYDTGQGVPQDYAKAHMWYNLAGSTGDADGAKNRDLIAKEMTPQQIEKAQDMARKCQERNLKGC